MALTNDEWRAAYEAHLKSEKWIAFRARIFSERGRMCEKCSVRHRLELHHLTYKRLGDELDTDVQVLCVECHKKEHSDYCEDQDSRVQSVVYLTKDQMKREKAARRSEKKKWENRPVGWGGDVHSRSDALARYVEAQKSSSASSLMRPIIDMTGD